MMQASHKKTVHDALVKAGYKNSHATKLVKGMAEHAKDMGFKVKAEAKMAEGANMTKKDNKAIRNTKSAKGTTKIADKNPEPKKNMRGRPRKNVMPARDY